MHKFICEKCGGNCELIINCADLEETTPYRCPAADYIEPEWILEPAKGIEQAVQTGRRTNTRRALN